MATIDIQRSYDWDRQVAPKTADALLQLVARVVGPDWDFRGTIERKSEAGIIERVTDVADIAGAGTDIRRADFHFGRYTPDPYVTWRYDDDARTVYLVVSTDRAHKDDAVQAVSDFESASGLRAAADNLREDSERISFRRTYKPGGLPTAQLLNLFQVHFAPFAGGPISTDVTTSAQDVELHMPAAAAVPTVLPETATRLRVRAEPVRYPGSRARFDLDLRKTPRLELELEGAATRQGEAAKIFAAFEAASGLQSVAADTDEEARIGRTGTYFTRDPVPLPVEWLMTLIAALRSEEPDLRWSSASIEYRDQRDKQTFSDLDLLAAEARREWANISILDCGYYGARSTIFVNVEPPLAMVKIELKGPSEAAAVSGLANLETALRLERWPTAPYRDVNTERAWRIRTFDRQKFAEALGVLVRDSVSRDPVLWPDTNYIAETADTGVSSYERFTKIDSLLDRMRDKRPFADVKLTAYGPRGRVLSFLISADHSRLEVRSSLDAGGFADIAAALMKRLPLDDAPTAEPSTAPKTLWQQVWSLEGLVGKALVGLAITTASVASYAVGRLTSQDSITIISPPTAADGTATVPSGCIAIRWEVKGRSLFDDGAQQIDQTGLLQFDTGDGRPAKSIEGFTSGRELFVPAGRWSLYVYDAVRQRRSPTITIVASAQANPPAGTPTTIDACPVNSGPAPSQ